MATLESNDIDQALQYFDRTRQRLLDLTAGLSEEQWRFKPAPDCWSIAQTLEHMVMVEERILGPVRELIAQAPPPPADFDFALIDRIIVEKIPDRSSKISAPDAIHPAGQLSPADALARVSQNYRQLAEYVASTPDLREHIIESRPLRHVTGGAHTMMDGYQWTLAVAAHDERHVRQIEEVQADAKYPR